MTHDQAMNYILVREPTFLDRAHNVSGHRSYVCPCCSNGKGEDGSGITITPRSKASHPKYHCFKCGTTGDIIDWAKMKENIDSTGKAIDFLCDYYNVTIDNVESEDIPAPSKEKEERVCDTPEFAESIPEAIDCFDYFVKCAQNLKPEYLQSRGLSLRTQKHYMIGTDDKWIHPVIKKRREKEKKPISDIMYSPRCIIPTSRYSYLARDTRNKLEGIQKKLAKSKCGAQTLFNTKYSSSKDIVFVTEGEIDAMSIYEASQGKYEAVGLGSISCWRSFVKECEPDGDLADKSVILMLDNDKGGLSCREILTEALENINVKVIYAEYPDKDPNEALCNHKTELVASVLDSANRFNEIYKEQKDEREKERPKQEAHPVRDKQGESSSFKNKEQLSESPNVQEPEM